MLVLLLSVLWVALDFWTKQMAIVHLSQQAGAVGNPPFQLVYVENRGAAFGILQMNRWFFVALTLLAVFFLVRYLLRHPEASLLSRLAIALIIGGAIGNGIDRVLHGYVVDFIQVNFVSFYDFPVFNVADIGITCGCLLLFLPALFSNREERS